MNSFMLGCSCMSDPFGCSKTRHVCNAAATHKRIKVLPRIRLPAFTEGASTLPSGSVMERFVLPRDLKRWSELVSYLNHYTLTKLDLINKGHEHPSTTDGRCEAPTPGP